MTAEVIQLYDYGDDNETLDTVAEYFYNIYPARLMERTRSVRQDLTDEDHFLAWLGSRGFIVVPFIEEDDDDTPDDAA